MALTTFLTSTTAFRTGVLLATAAATFAVGRVTAPTSVPAIGGSGNGRGDVNARNSGGGGREGSGTSVDVGRPTSDFAAAAGIDSAGIREVTGGRPMEEWLRHVLSQDDQIVRTSAFLRLLEQLETPEQIRAALTVFEGAVDRGRNGGEYAMLLQKWTQLEPKAALAFAETKSRGERWMAMGTVLRTWARVSPDEALDWARENPESLGGRGRRGEEGNAPMALALSQVARTNLDRALQVAGSETLAGRSRIPEMLATELINQRGSDAARLAVLNVPAGPFRDQLMQQVARRLAADDGPGTVDWVMTLPEQSRSSALSEAVGAWAQRDPVAAGNYLRQLPPTPATDASRERFAANVLRQDPEGAMAWASTISDEQQRSRALESLGRNWLRRDAGAAQNWIAQSDLPDPVKSRLLPQRAAK